MSDRRAEDPAAAGDPDTVVVLAVPRRAARIGLALVALVMFSLVIGVSAHRLLNNRSDTGSEGQKNLPFASPGHVYPAHSRAARGGCPFFGQRGR